MASLTRILAPILLLALAAPASAVSKKVRTDWGPEVAFGDGAVSAYFQYRGKKPKKHVDRTTPVALGVWFSAGFLNAWPQEPSDGTYDIHTPEGELFWPCCGHEVKPAFPGSVGRVTAFEHLVLNVNPHGHPPPAIYNLPHIDLHFYTIPESERLAIMGPDDSTGMCYETGIPEPLSCEDVAIVTAPVPADQQPPGHINVRAVEPGMGNHLIDSTAPEFNGGTFSRTFIFGSNAGRLIFFEPMITREHLLAATGEECVPISMPAALPEAGWYPTEYCIRYFPVDDAYTVSLEAWERYPESGADMSPSRRDRSAGRSHRRGHRNGRGHR